MTSDDPILPSSLLERVLRKLELHAAPARTLAGLNQLYPAWSCHVPFDNVQKRVWFAGDRSTPVTGGDPAAFFENWLAYGTGGTCWPVGGAICSLLQTLGFNARRAAGAMIEPGETSFQPAGHGTVIVKLDSVDYLVDASMLAFEALPLIAGRPASAGPGIHAIKAEPTGSGFDVHWYSGINRREAIRYRTHPDFDPVDHAFFLNSYDASTKNGPFNAGLFVTRRFPDSIIAIGRSKKFAVTADGHQSVTSVSDDQRRHCLVDEFGLSPEIVSRIPPDDANDQK